MRWIILSVPATCSRCGRLLKANRGGFWDSGIVYCFGCVVAVRGEVPQTTEELQMTAELLARGPI